MINEELLQKVLALLDGSAPKEDGNLRECAQTIHGLSEHTVRQLVTQNKIPYIRTGQGKRGKILINKQALLNYLT